ncbi:unnamed protein product [Allacma fusca]|uniref:Elongation of very long chain fatty acids protein n=1 Tax=Allacma fusca TaxID=39272 RepID=A0A8J2PAQ2_9HEXA|nr:unnamed protein product [Allacma fusca]
MRLPLKLGNKLHGTGHILTWSLQNLFYTCFRSVTKMANTTVTSVNYPFVVSKYTTAFDFEVIDLPYIVKTMDDLTPWILALCLVYIASIFALQHWMKDRAAYDLRKPLIIWNFGLALFSVVGALRQFPEVFGIVFDKGVYACGCLP